MLNFLEKQVDKLAKKMQQQAAGMRRSQPEIPLTQRWSPDCSPETSPRSDHGESNANDESFDDGPEDHEHVLNSDTHNAVAEVIAKHTDTAYIGETNKENTPLVNVAGPAPMRQAPNASLNAADEVSCRFVPRPVSPCFVLLCALLA
jgi:hypothetical protein